MRGRQTARQRRNSRREPSGSHAAGTAASEVTHRLARGTPPNADAVLARRARAAGHRASPDGSTAGLQAGRGLARGDQEQRCRGRLDQHRASISPATSCSGTPRTEDDQRRERFPTVRQPRRCKRTSVRVPATLLTRSHGLAQRDRPRWRRASARHRRRQPRRVARWFGRRPGVVSGPLGPGTMSGPAGEVARPVCRRLLQQTACSGTTRAAGARSVSPDGSRATPQDCEVA